MRADLNKERRDIFDRMWERYHHGLQELPPQVYLDIGYLMGWVMDADREAWPLGTATLAPPVDDPQIAELKKYIRWMAQTVHQSYHGEDPGAWNGDCPKDICSSTRRQLNDYGRKTL